MPELSIIVPVYNTGQYLEECLESIRCQSLQDIEVICVDDGSTDDSLTIIKQFVQKDSRFSVIQKANSGYGSSMNQGLDAVHGKYIGIVESDDWILQDMMQTLYECAEMNEADFVKADFYRFVHQSDGTVRRIYNHLTGENQYYNRVLRPSDEIQTFRFIMNIWSGIYRTDFIRINQIRFHETPGASFQDNGFWFQTFALAERVCFINKPLYMNRRDNPLSSVNNQEKVFASCREYDFIRQWVEEKLHGQRKYLYLCAEGRIRNYLFTIERIGNTFKPAFYERFKEDYIKLRESGEVAETLLAESWKSRISRILENPEKACKKEMQIKRRYMMLIGGYQDLIIYGAGNYAHKAYGKIHDIGEQNRIAYFAVTQTGKNPKHLYDIPVVEFESLSEEFKEKALVIVAVREQFREEVIQNIQKHGFCHYTDEQIFLTSGSVYGG